MVNLQRVADRLSEEKDRVRDVIRTEFADKLAELERDVEALRSQLSSSKTLHRDEVSRLQRSKDEELDAIHKRVQEAIAKKVCFDTWLQTESFMTHITRPALAAPPPG